MTERLPRVFLVRHGETAWSVSGQHTGLTDLELTETGEGNARRLGERLKGMEFARVLVSPLKRARRTCELAGFGGVAEVDGDLVEWDYGDYEGKTGAEIRAGRPDWDVFRDGCPGGEMPWDVGRRADRVVQRVMEAEGDVLVFSSGHILRVLASRWLGWAMASGGRYLMLGTGSVSVLGFERLRTRPVIELWNERSHLTGDF